MIRFAPDHQLFTENFVIGGTGSRHFRAHQEPELLKLCLEVVAKLVDQPKPTIFMSGGAQGWDAYLTKVAAQAGKPYVLVIPSPDYPGYYWGRRGSIDRSEHQQEWDEMAGGAAEIMYVNSSYIGRNGRPGGSNMDRNDAMTEVGDHFLVWDQGSPGTRDCIRKLILARTPFTDITKEYQKICSSTA